MFEGIFDHPVWDIILFVVIIRMFIPYLFQVRVYSSHSSAKPSEANRQVTPGKVTITASHSATRSSEEPGEYVEFEDIRS